MEQKNYTADEALKNKNSLIYINIGSKYKYADISNFKNMDEFLKFNNTMNDIKRQYTHKLI